MRSFTMNILLEEKRIKLTHCYITAIFNIGQIKNVNINLSENDLKSIRGFITSQITYKVKDSTSKFLFSIHENNLLTIEQLELIKGFANIYE